jgi:hypothetical protein
MKRKPITIALALLLVASFAFAGMNEKGKGMNAEHKMKGENCQLLTEDERDKVADTKRDFEKKAILLRANIKVLYMELDELVVAGKSGNAKLDELNVAKEKLSKEKLDHQVAVRKIVGEEKYKKMKMHKKMMPMKQGEHGKKMGGKMHDGRGQKGECKK